MRLLLIFFLLLFSGQAFAVEASSTMPTGSTFFQMIWGLLVVLGLIFLIYAFAKKRLSIGNMMSGTIKILEMRHLMPKAALALVEVKGRHYLLGIGNGHVELIADVSSKDCGPADFQSVLDEEK